jgi:O-antigen/teichoic acid export membrane protein
VIDNLAALRRRVSSTSLLVQNAIALMVSSTGTAGLGVVFWGLSTRLTSVGAVGRASAEVASMTLLANLAQLSLANIFTRYLPVAGRRARRFVTRVYSLCVVLALALGTGYVAAGFGAKFLPPGIGWRILFVIADGFWVVFVLQDAVLTGLRSARWVPVENILFALGKLALLPVFMVAASQSSIFLAWTVPVVGAVGGVSWYLFRTRIPEYETTYIGEPELPSGRQLASFVTAQYMSGLTGVLAAAVMPLIIIDRLGAVANGYFYLSWIAYGAFTQLLWNLSTSFLVEASADRSAMRVHVDRTIRVALLLIVPGVVIGVVIAPYLLDVFGARYAAHGTTLFRMLLLSVPGTAVTAFYSAFAWLEKRIWMLAARQFVSSATEIGVTVALIGHFGILAPGIACLATEFVTAVIILPTAVSRYRATRTGTGLRPAIDA